uniref:GOST seven transmembrane domain-containing protein n=1 Tax=Onchocerca volvulus TaxID=6282 RepID=A0A8R1TSH6_ONCVO
MGKLAVIAFIGLFMPLAVVQCKIHHLALRNDARRNILLTTFGYNKGGTFILKLFNFTVPAELVSPDMTQEQRNTDRFGVIGFTLSRGKDILDGVRSKPHVCQLSQFDQGFDALFFIFNFTKNSLKVIRTGSIYDLQLCKDLQSCPDKTEPASLEAPPNIEPSIKDSPTRSGFFGNLQNILFPTTTTEIPYKDYLPLNLSGDQYSTSVAIRFEEGQQGSYSFIYHNCFNYRAHGYSSQVAVHFTVDIIEHNPGSYLPAGDIAKPKLYLFMATMFAIAACIWIRNICHSSSDTIYKIHHLMTILVVLKSSSLFLHGVNYYFVSVYGHQREIWAMIYYITHLLKGALLFGTIILIGTGYTFFKDFLTDRDRKLFIAVLPLQVIDNIALIIIEESEFGEQGYQFWLQVFIFFDIVCCLAIIFPVVWSMRFLQQGARSDGKAAFNLEKLKLFRHFYLIIIGYIYLTRVVRFIIEAVVPFNYDWITDSVVEFSTFLFFVTTGYQFRPQKRNPYLKLIQDDDDSEALTKNGIFENISRLKRISVKDETLDDTSSSAARNDADSEDSAPEDIFHEQGTTAKKSTPKSSIL